MHASEAILANSVESGSTVWHKRHQEARERKVNPSTNLSSVCEFGVLERRVFFARHFPSASPLRPGMRLGFYDIPFVSFLQRTMILFSKRNVSLQQSHRPTIRQWQPLMFYQRHRYLRGRHCLGRAHGPLSRWRRMRRSLVS